MHNATLVVSENPLDGVIAKIAYAIKDKEVGPGRFSRHDLV